jgi:iron complex transport system substrate-binding protein
VSGDFYDQDLWPDLSSRDLIQQSAHSEIDFEALLDTRPEVYIVFATNGMVDTNSIREKLEPIGIKVLAFDFYKYDSLRTEMSVMAKIFGKQSEALDVFAEFDAIEKLVEDRISGLDEEDRPNVVMEHHASLTRDPVVLTGTSQWTDIIVMAGGINVFADLPGHTTHVDMEAILDANPDVLMFDGIVFDIGFNSFDDEGQCTTHMDFIKTRPGFENMVAIEDDRMAIMSGEFAGPMMIHGLPSLAKILHPDLFDDVDSDSYIQDFFQNYHGVEMTGKFVCYSAGS